MMRSIIVVMVCCLGAAACSGGDSDTGSLSAGAVRDLAVEAMADLDSYQADLSIDGLPVLTIQFEAPDGYKTVFRGGEYLNTEEDDPEVIEAVYVHDRVFFRECAAVGEDCGPWEERHVDGPVVSPGSPAYDPQWPAIALELASELSLDRKGGEFDLRGSANLLRVVLEGQRRAAEAAGVTSFGRECTSSPVLVVDGTPQYTGPTPTDTCRDTTYEDLLEQEADDLAAGDANPATIAARIDQETNLIQRFETVSPPQENDDKELTIVWTYSLFNEVTVEAPE